MNEKRCESQGHEWSCRRTTGAANEIVTFKRVTSPQIEKISQNPQEVNKVCPHGVIICRYCLRPFREQDQPLVALPTPDLSQLRQNLRRQE